MAKVMSPNAPQYEASGLRAAERYYATMSKYDHEQVVESAEQLCSTWRKKTDVRWHEFAAGFMTGALAIAKVRHLAEFNAGLNPPAPPWANYLMRRWMKELHPTRNRELAWRICRKAWNLSVEHPRRYHEYKAGMRMLWRLRWPVFQGKLP